MSYGAWHLSYEIFLLANLGHSINVFFTIHLHCHFIVVTKLHKPSNNLHYIKINIIAMLLSNKDGAMYSAVFVLYTDKSVRLIPTQLLLEACLLYHILLYLLLEFH